MASTPPPPDPAAGDDDWRNSVLQSYRNDEVREIAKVLAALEPGASTSSKLMLAMRFEDAIFKSATALTDYRKKLQKNYVPPAVSQQQQGNNEEQLLLDLRREYAVSLKYIARNANKAISDVSERLGTERAIQLQQHTDSAIQWAKELGLLQDPPPKNRLSEAQLQKLQQHLERRVENIRQYVVKHADPDLFLQETLERKDKDLPPRAAQLVGVNLSKRIQQLQNTGKFDAMAILQESLDKAQVQVPPPTRNNSNDVPAALIHLDKMRAASTALMAYLTIPDRQTTAPRNSLIKAHTIATQGMDFVKAACDKLPKPTTNQVTLQDAWNKVLELPLEVDTITTPITTAEEDVGNVGNVGITTTKRTKLDHIPPVTKSRVLLQPKRKTPSNLLPALKRKRAELIRPSPYGRGSHLILEFGTAFTMTIFFSPLVVSLRAMETKEEEVEDGESLPNNNMSKSSTTTSSDGGGASWTPLYHGLTGKDDLQVWGVTGSYEAVGHVVEERLRDASLHATHVLRKCFRKHVKNKSPEFEVEILEASALLEFLQLARTIYIPNWQDDDA
jgi:hypothetical protein